jgi:hypothetical protein
MLVIAACATGSSRPGKFAGYTRNVISRQEILECDARDALSLVRRLRGEFLSNRGRTSVTLNTPQLPVVYLDNVLLGGAEYLATIKPADIAEIRLYRAWEAANKFGASNTSGVIQVITYVPAPQVAEGADSLQAIRHRPPLILPR